MRRGTTVSAVALDDPVLTDGWWAAERNSATIWRWTDGNARLPVVAESTVVEVTIGRLLPYPFAPGETPSSMPAAPDFARMRA